VFENTRPRYNDLIKPGSFDTVTAAVVGTAKWQSAAEEHATPSTAPKLGYNLRKLAAVKTTRTIKSNNKASRLELMDKEFDELVSSAALTNLCERKFSNLKTQSTPEDLTNLKKLSTDFLVKKPQSAALAL